MRRPQVVWVATGTATRGGVASYVREVQSTPLWTRWSVRHVATHQDGSSRAKALRFVRGALTLWWLLVARRPDLVHVHSSARGSFVRKSIVVWSARALSVPVVLHIHDGGFADFHDRQPRLLRRFVRATLTTTEAVIALGPTWAARLHQIAPRARFVVVPNAVRMSGRLSSAPRSPDLLVLFLGRLGEDKGTHVLLEAWSRVVATRGAGQGDMRLVAAGDGEVDRFTRLAGELGIADSVELPGWLTTQEIDDMLCRAGLLVLPSRWEGQPMSVLEAMAHGVPVLATAVGGVPDLVDSSCGVLVPPDDVDAFSEALLALVQDPDRRARLGAAGAERVRQRFDVEVTWRALDALYRDLVPEAGP